MWGGLKPLHDKPSVPDVDFAPVFKGLKPPPRSKPSVPDERSSFLLIITR